MAEYSDPREFGFHPETVMTALMPYEQFSSKTRRLILGIDIGIASVGVCLIDIRNHEIILMASHIFKAPVEGKQKDISARPSGASIRRGYRSVRRTTKRRKNRKKVVRDIEKKYVLIPDDADGQWFAIRKDEPDVLHLRGKTLLYKLNARELARILYAFAGRRGYIDHGKGTTDDDSGKVKKALSENRKIIQLDGGGIEDLHTVENINPGLIGIAVDYLTRLMTGDIAEKAFHISLLNKLNYESQLELLRIVLTQFRERPLCGEGYSEESLRLYDEILAS